ncbi:MAG: DUF4340 domain-containing protein [Vicinamibacterales bacterium]
MRGLWSTIGLVAVAAGLGAYIYFVDSGRPDTEAKEKLFTVAADDVEELRVVAKGDTTVLKKTDGTWRLVEPVATDADQSDVTSLLGSLTGLEINREVDPKATDLAQYGLSSPKADITFTAKGGVTGRIRLGDQTPTGSDLYAVKDDGGRVVLVSTFVETNLSRSTFELRDRRVLHFERDKADGLEITNAKGTTVLTRSNSDWRVTAPSTARGDYGAIEGLLTRLSTATMSGIEATSADDLEKYGLDTPVSTVVVKTGSSSATLAVGAEADGKTYARDLSRPLVFTVDNTLAGDAAKGADDYRKQELFDFRAFSARQLVLTRGAETITLKKEKGAENTPDKWTLTAGGSTRDADPSKMEDMLAKLSNLRADGFVSAAPAAATPILKVSVEFDEDKKEEASIGRAGTDHFGSRPDETGAMRLTAPAIEEVTKAIDDVLAPPAPTPPPTAAGAAATPEKKP